MSGQAFPRRHQTLWAQTDPPKTSKNGAKALLIHRWHNGVKVATPAMPTVNNTRKMHKDHPTATTTTTNHPTTTTHPTQTTTTSQDGSRSRNQTLNLHISMAQTGTPITPPCKHQASKTQGTPHKMDRDSSRPKSWLKS